MCLVSTYFRYIFFWFSNDGLNGLYEPGLYMSDNGETSPGSCTHEEGEERIV